MVMLANDYGKSVCVALGIDPDKVRRVVIDATANEPVRVYIDYFGGPELFTVRLPTTEVEIVTNTEADTVEATV